MNNSEIRDFAVNILGCGCDESVFEHIDSEENIKVTETLTISKRILIGGRLLIYIAEAEKLDHRDLSLIIGHGLMERDSNGYNRLRLVVISANPDNDREQFERSFQAVPEADEKTHIHILSKKDVPA